MKNDLCGGVFVFPLATVACFDPTYMCINWSEPQVQAGGVHNYLCSLVDSTYACSFKDFDKCIPSCKLSSSNHTLAKATRAYLSKL